MQTYVNKLRHCNLTQLSNSVMSEFCCLLRLTKDEDIDGDDNDDELSDDDDESHKSDIRSHLYKLEQLFADKSRRLDVRHVFLFFVKLRA